MSNSLTCLDVKDIYNRLFERYGDLHWWPAKTPYEVMVGAILTQNTAWSNVEKALLNFSYTPTPLFIESITIEELVKIIKPAGFFNQKSVYLKSLTAWFKTYEYSVKNVRARPVNELRPELLSVKGVGRETADSILLYAFGLPCFVVDTYTIRLITRISGISDPPDYDTAQQVFISCLDESLYNNTHAMIVINAKDHCSAKPKCVDCPLTDICSYNRFMRTKA